MNFVLISGFVPDRVTVILAEQFVCRLGDGYMDYVLPKCDWTTFPGTYYWHTANQTSRVLQFAKPDLRHPIRAGSTNFQFQAHVLGIRR